MLIYLIARIVPMVGYFKYCRLTRKKFYKRFMLEVAVTPTPEPNNDEMNSYPAQ